MVQRGQGRGGEGGGEWLAPKQPRQLSLSEREETVRRCVSVCLNVGEHVWESACFCASSFKSKCSLCLSQGRVGLHMCLPVSENTRLELSPVFCSGCSPLPLASFY